MICRCDIGDWDEPRPFFCFLAVITADTIKVDSHVCATGRFVTHYLSFIKCRRGLSFLRIVDGLWWPPGIGECV